MYCLAKTARTTLCLVWCDTPKETARERIEASAFPADLFDDYAGRMEWPNIAKRWDNPLFQLRGDSQIEDEVLEQIKDSLNNVQTKPNDPVSTAIETEFDENYLNELDKRCQAICAHII